MKEDDLADIRDYMPSLPLIAKHLNNPKICIINLEKKTLHRSLADFSSFGCLDYKLE